MIYNTSNKTGNNNKTKTKTSNNNNTSDNYYNNKINYHNLIVSTLKHILQNDLRVENRMQPTRKQGDNLETLNYDLQEVGAQPFNECTLDAWHETVKACEVELFFYLEAGWKQRQKNMKERAEAVVKAVKADKAIDTIVFMDGHGRFFYSLLSQLRDDIEMHERLKNMRFVVVDIDGDVHRWHELFFPKQNVTSIHGNIYKLDSQYYAENCFLYFNFCGIGGSDGLQQFRSFITSEKLQYQTKFMVSFSTRGYRKDKRDWFPSSDVACTQFDIRDLTPGKLNFVTFELTRTTRDSDTNREIEKIKKMNAKELKEFVASHRLAGVKTNTGGRKRRSLDDFRNDVIEAFGQKWVEW